MIIPPPDEWMYELMKCNNPHYKRGYFEGYEQAKAEMKDLLSIMTAFHETTATICTEELKGEK